MNLDASWPKGSPEDICYKENSFGKSMDWSKCEFTHVDVAPVFPVVAGAATGRWARTAASNGGVERYP